MPRWEVWVEGWAASGEQHATAQLLGMTDAGTFQEACAAMLKATGSDIRLYNPERNSYWGCRLFDNEQAARKAFG